MKKYGMVSRPWWCFGALRNHTSLNARMLSGFASPFGTHGGALARISPL